MAEFDYEVVNGRKIRVRPVETVSEVDENGYFVRQPNHFTEGFGEGKNPVEAGRYRLVWAKLCHWSNRASIVRELLGLDEAISVNMVDHAEHEKNLGWEFVYDKDNVDPVLDIQFLSEAYYKADDDYTGRTTVPALIDVKTGKVVNNDYHRLTNYFEVDFKPFHKKNAPDLYPEELRKDIDEMNDWLFDNINNGVYKTTFCRSKEAYWDAYNSFYAAMDLLEERLENQRFLFGDYVTDSDVRLYPELVGEVLDTIKKAANEGYTMLLVSHEMNFVKNVATRVIFLENGKIIEDGPPKEVFNHPKSDRVREFFAKINRMVEPEYSI